MARDTRTSAERILAAVRAIPRGQVAGYGEVARRAGLPGRARLAARVLGSNTDPDLPWHRVLRSDGRIAFPEGSEGHLEQSRRLRAEGVRVEKGRVRMPRRELDLDAELWGLR
ncbi:MGMT family protein [Cognatiluteimonas lumbrici]|uniref:MGMT family protein n=1 Tax=Cognatiluteimonas lumbrici TaxID=2559601 RepID=UPI001125C741|nr:MGMT family protein [Luteimonas lumbrici]